MPALSLSRRLPFAQYRRMARVVERSENAAAVRGLLRPRGVVGLRSRFPIALQLLRAARERRLLTFPDGSFVMLRAPVAWRPAERSSALTALRVLDEYWDLVRAFAAMLLVLLSAVVCALLPEARSAALLLALLDLVLASVMMTVMVLRGTWLIHKSLEPGHRSRGGAVEQYAAEQWSAPLCHVAEPSELNALLEQVLSRVSELHTEFHAVPGAASSSLAPVLIHEGAVTSAAAAEAVAQATLTASPEPGAMLSGVMFLHRGRLRELPKRPLPTLAGFTPLFVGTAILLANIAQFVAETERAACRPTSCAGHPADYASALRWVLQRLLWSDPDGLSPITFRSWSLGWLISFLTPVLVACVMTVLRHYGMLLRERRDVFEEEMSKAIATTSTLVLVAADVERAAVIASLQASTGRNGPVSREAQGRHTVFDLGMVSRTHVLLAQSEQGIESPTAMTLTASNLIRERRPDFVILVGICYGLKGEPRQAIGDIVVANQVQNLNWRKALHRDGAPAELIRGERVATSPTLLDRFRAATADWDGARVHRGLMLSESVLVDSAVYRAHWQETFPDALAGEMEGAGIYAAAAMESTDWIVIKAVSDWGDGTKNSAPRPETAQEQAARNAADFLVHVLKGTGLDKPPQTSTDRVRARD